MRGSATRRARRWPRVRHTCEILLVGGFQPSHVIGDALNDICLARCIARCLHSSARNNPIPFVILPMVSATWKSDQVAVETFPISELIHTRHAVSEPISLVPVTTICNRVFRLVARTDWLVSARI